MSRKNTLEPVYLTATTATAMPVTSGTIPTISLASAFNTLSTSVKYQDNISYQMNITTTNSTGTFTLQGSNDNVNFADLTTAGVVNAANDISVINVNQFPFAFIRLKYTPTIAGTGICSVILMARNIGA